MTKARNKVPEKPEMTEQEEQELRDKPINVFRCGHPDCEKIDQMVFEEFKHHVFTKHALRADQFKGKKQMVLHMDGAQWFSSVYSWQLEGGLQFTQFVTMARAKDDPMRYEC